MMLYAVLLQVPTPAPPADFVGFFQAVLDAVTKKNWWVLASMAVVALTWVTRVVVPKLHNSLGAWLGTDRGGAVLALFYAITGAAATTMAAWKKPDLNLLLNTVFVAVGAIGGFSLIKKIFFPSDTPAEKKPEVKPDITPKSEGDKPAPPPLPPAALLPVALAFSIFAASCACSKPENANSPGCRIWNVIVSCGGPAVAQGLEALILAVVPAISGSVIDWGALAALEEKYGTDAVACAIAEAGLRASNLKLPAAQEAHVAANAKTYLSSRHVLVRM